LKSIVFLLLASSSAQACPTQSDLTDGIRVLEPGSGVQVFKAIDAVTVSHISSYPNGDAYDNELIHGTFVKRTETLRDGEPDPNSRLITDYRQPDNALPAPDARTNWRQDTTVTSVDDVYTERQSVVWGDVTAYDLGDCSFEAIPGTIRYQSKYGKTTENVMYLQDVGISLLIGFQQDSGIKSNYSYAGIEAVGD